MKVENFIDELGMIHADPDEISDNGILFTVENYLLQYLKDGYVKKKNITSFIKQVKAHEKEPGVYWQRPGSTENPGSHDNATAIACFSYLCGLDYHNTLILTSQFLNPRDVIFYNYLKGSWFAHAGMPYVLMAHINSASKEVSEASGKLLVFVRQMATMHKSSWMRKSHCITENMLKRLYGDNHWTKVFATYFKHYDHPNNVLARKIWG